MELKTRTLWRPVGQKEFELISASEYTKFPPRLMEQPIFYPVCNERYAFEIAIKWNKKVEGTSFVAKFEVKEDFLANYTTHIVGASYHEEFWIPAEELD